MSVINRNALNGSFAAGALAAAAYEVAKGATRLSSSSQSPLARNQWLKIASIASTTALGAASMASTLGLIHVLFPPPPPPADPENIGLMPEVVITEILGYLTNPEILKILTLYPNLPGGIAAAGPALLRRRQHLREFLIKGALCGAVAGVFSTGLTMEPKVIGEMLVGASVGAITAFARRTIPQTLLFSCSEKLQLREIADEENAIGLMGCVVAGQIYIIRACRKLDREKSPA